MANTEASVDRNLLQDIIDSMIAHGKGYKEALKEFNKKFEVPYDVKDNVVRRYPVKFGSQ